MSIHAKVYDKDNKHKPESPLNGPVVAISSGLQPILCCDGDPGFAIKCVANYLETMHSGRVTQKVGEFIYIYVWNGNTWCRKCVEMGTFEIDFGSAGTVVVEIEEGQHYKV